MVTTVLHVICEDFFYFHYRSYNFKELLDIKRIVEYFNSKQKYEMRREPKLPTILFWLTNDLYTHLENETS